MSQPTISDNPYRASRAVVPRAYRLRLMPDLEGATFEGTLEVDVEVIDASRFVTLNATDLDVAPATIRAGVREWVSQSTTYDERFETVTFEFADELASGPATVYLDFRGVLNDQLHGFYRSTFVDASGETRVIATTQFEATDARRAFPCWDDPALKATFAVTLVVPEGLAAFANTRELSSRLLGDGTREVCFAPSMVMSTYLVAFAVGPFEVSPVTSVAGTELRVIYPPGKAPLSSWSIEIAVHALEFFTQYFGIEYPGDKIDLIAIPDFAAGAMENLGLVTFRDEYLLVDRESASTAELERIAMVVNHELAHMWFGDLVTMEWWEGLWLNEAFATFMESLCTDHFRPEWQKWVRFNPEREIAFSVDGQHTTRAIEYPVVSPDECRGMFDALTYLKGNSVLRMLEQYLGAETFRAGVRVYLGRHAYANAVTADLWTALEEASGEPVGEIMDTWILQGGFPLVRVSGPHVTQEPFTFRAPVGESAIGSSWRVPLRVRSLDGGVATRHLLDEGGLTLEVAGDFIVNAGGSGFFRSAYDSAQLGALGQRLGELDELERAVLVADTWSAVLVGRTGVADFFSLAQGLRDVDEPATWDVVVQAVSLVERIADDAARDELARVVTRLTEPVFRRLGWGPIPGESSQAGELRAMIISLLGHQGRHAEVVAEARRRFDDDLVSGDLANAIVSLAVAHGGAEVLEVCEDRRRRAATPQDEQRYLYAPAASNDRDAVLAAAQRAFTDVRTQDAPYLIGALMRSRDFGPDVWRVAVQRRDEAVERFPSGSPVRMMSGVTTFVKDPEIAAQVRRYHESAPFAVAQQQLLQMLDLMDVHVALGQRVGATLVNDLRAVADA